MLCLGALSRGPCSGYEIRKLFEDGPFGYFQDISFGSIYPALRQLAAEGLVTVTDFEQDRRPDKKIYKLTGTGLDVFAAAVQKDHQDDKIRSDLLFSLYFAHLIPDNRIAEMLDARIAMHRKIMDDLEHCIRTEREWDDAKADGRHPSSDLSGQDFVRGLGLAIHKACYDYYVANRDDLIKNSRTGPVDSDNLDALHGPSDQSTTLPGSSS